LGELARAVVGSRYSISRDCGGIWPLWKKKYGDVRNNSENNYNDRNSFIDRLKSNGDMRGAGTHIMQ
jgi:hypothetical protein